MAGIKLGTDGRAQAERLGRRIGKEAVSEILASPRERTQETAAAIAGSCRGIAVGTEAALDEIDFGSWSSRDFNDLNNESEWRRWNTVRSIAHTPAGETMLDVQARAVGLIHRLHAKGENGAIALVTHADVIKAIVAFYLGLSLDAWPRFDVDPASITTLVVEDWNARIVRLNERGD